jgi:hypothetical protein
MTGVKELQVRFERPNVDQSMLSRFDRQARLWNRLITSLDLVPARSMLEFRFRLVVPDQFG